MAHSVPLKVAVIGPAGQCGSCVVDELLARGHNVVGMSRNPPKEWQHTIGSDTKAMTTYTARPVDIRDTKALKSAFSDGFDAIVCAYAAPLNDLSVLYETGVEGHGLIKTALLESDHAGPIIIIGMCLFSSIRKVQTVDLDVSTDFSIILIGGAGSLRSSKGIQLCQEPDFAYGWWWVIPLSSIRSNGPVSY